MNSSMLTQFLFLSGNLKSAVCEVRFSCIPLKKVQYNFYTILSSMRKALILAVDVHITLKQLQSFLV